jgi:4'-phosphopantetheinyl transferase
MSATLDWDYPPLAGCLTAVPIREDPHSSTPPVVREDSHSSAPPGPAVYVWRADLDAAAPGELLDLLSPEERARAARIVRAQARARWARSRGVLRALLGLYLECDPRALRFQTGPHGKPTLPESELSFNVSHSAGLALYALAPAAPVGVDVEVLAPRPLQRDEVALAERVLGPDAAQRLRALPPTARHREFLRQWVRHEAALKCLGVGFVGSRGAETAARTPAQTAVAAETPAQTAAAAARLRVSALDVGPHAAAALAVQAAPPQLRPWELRCSGPPPSVR